MSEPTPRPWRVSKTGVFVESTKESICAMFTEVVLMDKPEANAAHIVKCVNEHDGLVAACEGALQLANTLILNLSGSEGDHYEQLKFVNIESCNRLRNIIPELEAALVETAVVAG